MFGFTQITWALLMLLLVKAAAQLWLERLNRKHVLAHASAVPEPFKGIIDEPTFRKSVEYTLARGSLEEIETAWDTAVLLIVLVSGILPLVMREFVAKFGGSAWSNAAVLFFVGIALSLTGLPLSWFR